MFKGFQGHKEKFILLHLESLCVRWFTAESDIFFLGTTMVYKDSNLGGGLPVVCYELAYGICTWHGLQYICISRILWVSTSGYLLLFVSQQLCVCFQILVLILWSWYPDMCALGANSLQVSTCLWGFYFNGILNRVIHFSAFLYMVLRMHRRNNFFWSLHSELSLAVVQGPNSLNAVPRDRTWCFDPALFWWIPLKLQYYSISLLFQLLSSNLLIMTLSGTKAVL